MLTSEPTAAELSAIEAEWPLIEAELAVVDAEIRAVVGGGWPVAAGLAQAAPR